MHALPGHPVQGTTWEWRIFAPSLARLRKRLPQLDGARAAPSRDIHIVCMSERPGTGDYGARIHDGVLELRQLVRKDHRGPQLWRPVLESVFPVEAHALNCLLECWGLGCLELARGPYDEQRFKDILIRASSDVRLVGVEKRRIELDCDNCRAEFVYATINGVVREGFCLEHESPSAIHADMYGLGLSGPSGSYAGVVKEVLGLTLRSCLA